MGAKATRKRKKGEPGTMIDLSDFETIDEIEELIIKANEKIQQIRDEEFQQEDHRPEERMEEFRESQL